MIFTKNPQYTPYEQTNKGGPVFLDLVSASNIANNITVTIPSHKKDGTDLLAMWKLSSGAGNPVTSWGNKAGTTVKSWLNKSVITSPYHTGIGLYVISGISDTDTEFDIVFSGYNGSLEDVFEWFIVAEIIGKPIYPTRVILNTKSSYSRSVVDISDGRINTKKKSEDRVFAGVITCKGDDPIIAETFDLLDEHDGSFTIWPCGLDLFKIDQHPIYRRPGYSKKIAITSYTGSSGYDKGLDTGDAINLKLSFKEANR